MVAALSFLTVVPIGDLDVGERDLRRGVVLFPVVGGALGGLVALGAWGASFLVPSLVAAVLGVTISAVATAALHLDGLGDVADGVGASLTHGEPRAVMHDPRLGTFGVVAVALDLLLKTALLSALLVDRFPWEVIAAGALSRIAPVFLAWRRPYTGAATGTWIGGVGARTCVSASVLALTIAISCAGWAAAGMVTALIVAGAPIAWWSRRHLGGITGDGLGAATELAETLSLLAAAAFVSTPGGP